MLLFLFWGNSGRTENRKSKQQYCLGHFSVYHPSLKRSTIRHSPRTFPLGLLAPRCLGFLLILAIPALRSGGEGRRLFGGRKESFPQLRSPPRSGLLEYSVLPFVLWSFGAFWLRLACLRSPPSHNPLPRFHIGCMWCRFRFGFLYCKITAALIL